MKKCCLLISDIPTAILATDTIGVEAWRSAAQHHKADQGQVDSILSDDSQNGLDHICQASPCERRE